MLEVPPVVGDAQAAMAIERYVAVAGFDVDHEALRVEACVVDAAGAGFDAYSPGWPPANRGPM